MRPVYSLIVIDIESGEVERVVADYGYLGPWAAARGETKTDEMAKQQNAQAVASQNAALAKQNTAVGDYKASIAPFQTHRFLSPEYQAKLRLLTATGASGAEKTAESELQDFSSRTGSNTGNVAATAQEMARDKERFQTAANISNEVESQNKDTEDMRFATTALGQIPGVYTSNYGTAAGLQGSALSAQSNVDQARASQTPWWQTVLGAAASVGSAFCAMVGELVELFEGGSIAIEKVAKGTELLGIDGGPEKVIEDPEAREADCVVVEAGQQQARVSKAHTFARAGGGYVTAEAAKGVIISPLLVTVNDVRPIGRQMVYRIKTDRTHTYRVGGFWSLE